MALRRCATVARRRGFALLDALIAALAGALLVGAVLSVWQRLHPRWLRQQQAFRSAQAIQTTLTLMLAAIREADAIEPTADGFMLQKGVDAELPAAANLTCLGHEPIGTVTQCRIRFEPDRLVISDDSGATPQSYFTGNGAGVALERHALRFGVLSPPAALQWLPASAAPDLSQIVAVDVELMLRTGAAPPRRWQLRAALRSRLPLAPASGAGCDGFIWPACLLAIAAIAGIGTAMLKSAAADLALAHAAVAQQQAFAAADWQLFNAEQAMRGCRDGAASVTLHSRGTDARQLATVTIHETLVCAPDAAAGGRLERRSWRQLARSLTQINP